MMRLLSILFGVLLLPSVGMPSAEAGTLEQIIHKKEFKICVNRHALPFSEYDSPTPGAHVEMAELFARELGVSLTFSWITFRYRAKYKQCDAFMGTAVLGEEGFVKRTNPYLNVKMYVVSKPGLKINTLDDFDGLKVATPSASLAHTVFVNRPKVEIFVSMPKDKEMLDALVSGRVDAAIVSNVGVGWYKKSNPGVEFELTSAEFVHSAAESLHSFNGYPMAIGFRKSDSAMVVKANEILKKITSNGELAKILEKYGLDLN